MQTILMPTSLFFETAYKDLHIDENRLNLLNSIVTAVLGEIQKNRNVNLNYICTHNSRRSQFAQIWSCFATDYFNLSKINSFSGGTKVTSFFRSTTKTLQEVGFNFQIEEYSHQNPKFIINYENCKKPIIGFSKLYDDKSNKKPFIAIITCSATDENCPFIPEANHRFNLPFSDPRIFDNTNSQYEKYLELNKKIAGEIYYLFNQIAISTI